MFNIERKSYPEQQVIFIRTQDSLYAMGKYIGKLYRRAKEASLEPDGPTYCVYYEKPENPKSVDYEMGLPVKGTSSEEEIKTIGGENCVYLRVKGSYKQISNAYKALSEYIEAEGLELSGPPREVYVKGPLLGVLTFIPVMITDIYFPLKE